MSFTSLINLRHCKVSRKTDILLEQTPLLAAMSLTHQPPRAACMQVKISDDTSGKGRVIITGETFTGGAGDLETFDFSENGEIVGIKEFISVVDPGGVTLSTFEGVSFAGDGSITIRAVTKTGQPIYWEKTIFDEMKCWVDMHRGGLTVIIPGGVITGITKLFCKYNPLHPLQEADLIYYNGQKYRIDFIEWCASRAKKIHHLELILKKAKTDEE